MAPDCEFLLATDADGKPSLTLSGALTMACVGRLDHAMRKEHPEFKVLDISGLHELDTAGAWLIWRLSRDAGAQVVGADEKAQRLIGAVRCCSGDAPIAPPHAPPLVRIVETVGLVMIGLWQGTAAILSFLGGLICASGRVIRHPSRMRWTALVRQTELVGVDALAIVGLMSFLVGVVIAQQGAVQLQQFGAEIYTVNLTGRISLRELGVLMTAIMVAGRSGSAFAAQIGTMKLTEEVDAMRTIGVSPMEALVLPRVLAAVFMMPLLGLYSALIAIVGGATISAFTLDIPFFNFLSRVKEVVPMIDLWVGLIKGPVFGLIVAMTGCYQGMQVKGSSEEVGLRTTQAVVQAIFAVIVIDAFFAVFFSEVGWI